MYHVAHFVYIYRQQVHDVNSVFWYVGSIHVWDLREHSSIHNNRDAVDLGIAKGIRKPCFSSHFQQDPNIDSLGSR